MENEERASRCFEACDSVQSRALKELLEKLDLTDPTAKKIVRTAASFIQFCSCSAVQCHSMISVALVRTSSFSSSSAANSGSSGAVIPCFAKRSRA